MLRPLRVLADVVHTQKRERARKTRGRTGQSCGDSRFVVVEGIN